MRRIPKVYILLHPSCLRKHLHPQEPEFPMEHCLEEVDLVEYLVVGFVVGALVAVVVVAVFVALLHR